MWLAAACSNGGDSSLTGSSAVTLAAKPKRTVRLDCNGEASVHVAFLTGTLGTVIAVADLGTLGGGGCGQSTTVTGVGKADAFAATYQIATPPGGEFSRGVLHGKGATDSVVIGSSTLTLTIK